VVLSMHKRKLLIATALLVVIMIMAGCKSTSVKDDLNNYVNQELKALKTLELEALRAYQSVTGENYENDAVMHEVMTETVIPKYREYLTALQEVKPKTKEIKELHDKLLEGTNSVYFGLQDIVLALEKQDESLIDQGNSKLELAEIQLGEFWDRLEELAQKNDIEYLE